MGNLIKILAITALLLLDAGRSLAQSCVDSDRHEASPAYSAGRVTHSNRRGASLVYLDQCNGSGTKVLERSCDANGMPRARFEDCPYGCAAGRCLIKRPANEKGCYLKLELEVTRKEAVTIALKSITALYGYYAAVADYHHDRDADFVIEILGGRQVVLDQVGFDAPGFMLVDYAEPAEGQSPVVPLEVEEVTVFVPLDTRARQLRITEQEGGAVTLLPVPPWALACPGCKEAGQGGIFGQHECCPGLFARSVSNSLRFSCSECPHEACPRLLTQPSPSASASPSPTGAVSTVGTVAFRRLVNNCVRRVKKATPPQLREVKPRQLCRRQVRSRLERAAAPPPLQ